MTNGTETLKLTFLDIDSATATMRLSAPATALEAILQALPKAGCREQFSFLVQSLAYSQPGVICESLLKLPDGDAVRNAYRQAFKYPSWSTTSSADSGVLRISVRGAVENIRNGLGVDRPIWDADIAMSLCDCILRRLRGPLPPPEVTARDFAESLVLHCRDRILAALPSGTPSHGLYLFSDELQTRGIPTAQPVTASASLGAVRLEDALSHAIREAAPASKGVEDPVALVGSLYRKSPGVRLLFGELGIGEQMSVIAAKQVAGKQTPPANPKPQDSVPPELAGLLVDLTQQAREGKLPPCVGREREVDQVMSALGRMTKNNPVLIGEAGVGKTAVVEALAQRIAVGDCPDALGKCRILSLSANGLVSGTIYRGMFEERIKKLIEFAEEHKDTVIVFIDELHTICGAGDCKGGHNDAANALKPALARGGFRLIGATTTAEYSFIQKDGALERRFQKVFVREPGPDAMRVIMDRLVAAYATPRGVAVKPEVRAKILELASSHLQNRRFPDKAVDVLDEAATRSVRQGDTVLTIATVEQVIADFAGIHVARVRMSRHERLAQALASVGGQQGPQVAETCRRLALYLAGSPLSRRGDRPVSFVCQGHLARQAAEAVCDELAPGATLLIDGETILPPARMSGKAADKAQGWSGMVGESRAVLVNLETLPAAATGLLIQALRGRFPGAEDALFGFVQQGKGNSVSTERHIGFGVDSVGAATAANPLAALLSEVDGTFDFGSPSVAELSPDTELDSYVAHIAKARGLVPAETTDLAARLKLTPTSFRVEAAIWMSERSLQRSAAQGTASVPAHSAMTLSTTAPVVKAMAEDECTMTIEEVFACLLGDDNLGTAPVSKSEAANPATASSAQPLRDDEDLILALRRAGVDLQFKSILATLAGKAGARLVPLTVGKIVSTDLTTFRPPSFGPVKQRKFAELQAWLRTHRVESALPNAQATMPTEESGKAA